MKILYYDCFAGISGDMNLGAMIDLGVDPEYLQKELKKLPLEGYELVYHRGSRRGVAGMKVDVQVPHHHAHDEHHHTHHHAHGRTHKEIRRLISQSDLSPQVREVSLRIFQILAEAEGKIHRKDPDEVHFHEVGAVDSIIDIVGAAICFVDLKVDQVLSSPVELGSGFVQCAHGTFPVPAPATSEILRNFPVKMGAVPYEATTPTGAAILAALTKRGTPEQAPPEMKIQKIGYGLGTRDGEVPNVLRVYLAEANLKGMDQPKGSIQDIETVEAVLVECNLDDMAPERYDLVMDLLLRAGADDVFLTPIIMKKSRPAVTLQVLCTRASAATMRELLLYHTTTLGLRQYTVTKWVLPRKEIIRKTPYGDIRVKQTFANGKVLREKPEFEDLKRISLDQGVPIEKILPLVQEPPEV